MLVPGQWRLWLLAAALLALPVSGSTQPVSSPYVWAGAVGHEAGLSARLAPPEGFVRVPAPPGSFADWLRGLPLKPDGSPVKLFSGAIKWRQDAHAAVVDIDVGRGDLQQCAD